MSAPLAIVVLSLSVVAGRGETTNANPVSISFNESLVGFGVDGGSDDDTVSDFKWAYEHGKEANNTLSFTLHVNIPDIKKFVANELHPGVCIGSTTVDVITGPSGAVVGEGGKINIFDHGVLPTHELRMEYTLPFRAANGSNYTLIGVKHIPGNDCINLLEHMTTLYVHVRDMDTPAPHQIVRKGMVKIPAAGIISLIASLRLHGGNPFQELEGLVDFAVVLAKDVIQDCLNKSAFANKFHYFWASDGDAGFLLDMVRRPTSLELRLASFKRGSPPTVTRQLIDGTADYHEGNDTVTLGPLTLSNAGVNGTIGGIPIDIGFDDIYSDSPARRNMVFLPEVLRKGPAKVISEVVPLVTSQYGKVTVDPVRKHSVGDTTLKAGVPLVKTTYPVPFGLSTLRWAMLSASQFKGTDLQVEIVATPINILNLATLGYIAPAYVLFERKEYHLNTLLNLVDAVKVHHAGDFDAGQTHRLFEATIIIKPNLVKWYHITLSCSAPSEAFAFLEKEGNTYIHTTLVGDCTATVKKVLSDEPTIYTSTGVNLIEVKGSAPAAAQYVI